MGYVTFMNILMLKYLAMSISYGRQSKGPPKQLWVFSQESADKF